MVALFEYGDTNLYLPFTNIFNIDESFNDINFINIKGEQYTIPGKSSGKTFEINGFISNKELPFYDIKAPKTIDEFISFFSRARKEKKPIKIILAQNDITIINGLYICTFKHSNIDTVGDISYIISCKEYKVI